MSVYTASICLRNHAKLSILVLTTAFLSRSIVVTSVRLTRWSPKYRDTPPYTTKHGRHWKIPSLLS